MKRFRACLWTLAALAAFSAPAAAQPATAPASGFKSDLLASMDSTAKKLVDLAQAEPADKFGWRPASGVRSVSEVYMHVAGANFLLPTFLGVKAPEGVDREMETKVTAKDQVVEQLRNSIAHARAAVEGASDADLDQKVKLFGHEMSRRGVLLALCTHMHEHLGQAIAYARVNGITPPWSAAEGAPPAKSSSR